MTLDSDSMVVKPSDLMLKHGAQIAGTWTILGIVDALPDDGAQLDSPLMQIAQQNVLAAAAISANNPVGMIASMMAPAARLFLGRPGASFGLTPLLIFRQVTGR